MTDETTSTSAPEAPVDVDAWLQQGELLRKRLLEERAHHQAAIEAIDAKLAKLGTSTRDAETPARPAREEARAGGRSNGAKTLTGAKVQVPAGAMAPDLVRAILAAHPQGLTAPEVISEAQSLQPKIDPRNVHSALQRSSWFAKSGKPRKYRYFLSEAGKEAAD